MKKEEKNGAHKHLLHLQKLRASKYSRHVFLCPHDKTKTPKNYNVITKISHVDSLHFLPDTLIFEEKREKNGAHNHLSQLQKLRTSKYSRHVVLCK